MYQLKNSLDTVHGIGDSWQKALAKKKYPQYFRLFALFTPSLRRSLTNFFDCSIKTGQ